MTTKEAQRFIREASPAFLAQQGFGLKEAVTVPNPTRQNKFPGPSTLIELAEALRNPLPPEPPKPPCHDALEAFAAYNPLTLEMVRDRLSRERAARDAILEAYTKRTGQAVDYCDCDLGVVEEEIEGPRGITVISEKCEVCDGLGVIEL